MNTPELLVKLWPVWLALVSFAFWLGTLEFRVRTNTENSKENRATIEEQRTRVQKVEVDQAGWKATLERIDRHLLNIDKKLDSIEKT